MLSELKYLVTKKRAWRRSNLYTNLAIDKANDIVVDGTWRKLKVGFFLMACGKGRVPRATACLRL